MEVDSFQKFLSGRYANTIPTIFSFTKYFCDSSHNGYFISDDKAIPLLKQQIKPDYLYKSEQLRLIFSKVIPEYSKTGERKYSVGGPVSVAIVTPYHKTAFIQNDFRKGSNWITIIL